MLDSQQFEVDNKLSFKAKGFYTIQKLNSSTLGVSLTNGVVKITLT